MRGLILLALHYFQIPDPVPIIAILGQNNNFSKVSLSLFSINLSSFPAPLTAHLPNISAWIQQCKWTLLDCTCFHINIPHAWLNATTSLLGELHGWWTVKVYRLKHLPLLALQGQSSPVAGSLCAHSLHPTEPSHFQLITDRKWQDKNPRL